jgi:hypothetical protein
MSGYASAGGFAMPCAPARQPDHCRECGTPLDEVPFGPCSAHALAALSEEWPPQLTMDERDFAPPEVHE